MKVTPLKYAKALASALENAKNPEQIICNLLDMLRRKKQYRLLPKIVQAFEQEWNKKRGIVKMDITYPEKFQQSVGGLEKSLSAKLGKQLRVSTRPSKTLIGGFVVRVSDLLIDASIESRLKDLGRRLQ